MQTTEKRYLSCAETATLLRKALKAAFPSVKFTVRSSVYSGGASIDVRWSDGPCTVDVEKVAKQFEGADFDGMIDLKTSSDHWMMSDGTIRFAYNPGTCGSGGVHPSAMGLPPHPDAQLVRLGADHVFCNRIHTAGFLEGVARRWAEYWGKPVPSTGASRCRPSTAISTTPTSGSANGPTSAPSGRWCRRPRGLNRPHYDTHDR